jgi:hypothetical protein
VALVRFEEQDIFVQGEADNVPLKVHTSTLNPEPYTRTPEPLNRTPPHNKPSLGEVES